ELATQPGTEIKVTPDRLAPIIPKATIYQGDCLLPTKKLSLSPSLDVILEIKINKAKYAIKTVIIKVGVIAKFKKI
ncbi:MAG: hypothetical protein ACI9B2_001116, partial [Flavobacteriales bacterium]